MAVSIGRPDVVDPAEAQAVATSIHSRQMQQQQNGSADTLAEHARRLIPWYNGRRRLDHAPGTWWMHAIAFALTPGLDGGERPASAGGAVRGGDIDALVRALASLKPTLREAVVLRYGHGLTYREIAAVMTCPPKTAESRVRLAHNQLRGLLRNTGQSLLEELLSF